MLPAALLGVNGRVLLERALAVDTDAARVRGRRIAEAVLARRDKLVLRPPTPVARLADWKIGRASCRERGEISVVAGSLKKKKKIEGLSKLCSSGLRPERWKMRSHDWRRKGEGCSAGAVDGMIASGRPAVSDDETRTSRHAV